MKKKRIVNQQIRNHNKNKIIREQLMSQELRVLTPKQK